VGDADEGIVLTEQEREVLAGLAESIGDPWLARQLSGRDPSAPGRRPSRRPAWLRLPSLPRLSGWVGPALALFGAVVAVAAFMASTVIASLGLLMMGAGLWKLAADRGDDLRRWVASRQSANRPGTSAAVPPTPRTPPAAG
jgi:hypothetical protein